MKTIILFLIAASALSSCCPKFTSTTTATGTIDTVTVYEPDTVFLPASSNNYQIDFASICDSLSKGKSVGLKQQGNKGSVVINVPANGVGTVICETDSLQLIIDSLRQRQVIKIDSSFYKETVVYECKKPFHKFSVAWFCGSLAGIIILIALKVKK